MDELDLWRELSEKIREKQILETKCSARSEQVEEFEKKVQALTEFCQEKSRDAAKLQQISLKSALCSLTAEEKNSWKR